MYRPTINQNRLPLTKMDTIYIGYDAREHRAAEVLIRSIEDKASTPLNIVTLNQLALRRAGLYRRAPDIKSTVWGHGDEEMLDCFDEKPFSTEFSITRFLVPFLNQYEGFALYMDSDMYFRCDPTEIFDLYADPQGPAVHCVKHQYEHGGHLTNKLFGCTQSKYARKNWSSLVLWNCAHPDNLNLTVDDVNTKSGSWLHNFSWLNSEIGSIPEEWNWLDGHSPQTLPAKNVHFTSGGPWLDEAAGLGFNCWKAKRDGIDQKYVDEWLELSRTLNQTDS